MSAFPVVGRTILGLPGLMAMALLVSSPGIAGDSPWNTGTDPRKPAQEGSVLESFSLRVYLNPDGTPANPADGSYALDVVPEFATCPDGRRVVKSIRIGGSPYRLEAQCSRGAETGNGMLRCNPKTWTCVPAATPGR